jgi:hypothetical protein
MFGLTVNAGSINQALDGITSSVVAAALNTLTEGRHSDADLYHRHSELEYDQAGEAQLALQNVSTDAQANMKLSFSLPGQVPSASDLLLNPDTGFLRQRHDGATYELVGTVHREYRQAGTLTSSITGGLIGSVPIDGEVVDLVLSAGANIESSDSSDGVSAPVYVNGSLLTTTAPQLTSAAGSGFRCTDRGDGTAAGLKTDGTAQVQRGDVLTVDLTRTVNGSVSQQMRDLVLLVVIQPSKPE